MQTTLWILYFCGYAVKNIQSYRHTSNSQLKIIRGILIPIRQRPYMISLHSGDEFICGGSILTSTWIITAQHCMNSPVPRHYYIRAGSSYHDRGGIISSVVEFQFYNAQYYKRGVPVHDIVLLKINPPLNFSSKIQPVKLPSSNLMPPWLWVSGWGETEKKLTSDILRIVKVPYVSYERCAKSTTYINFLNRAYHVCYGEEGFDSCYGDSGGPLARGGVIYGIVSFGILCAVEPGVYTKIFFYNEWINEVINLQLT